MVHCTRIKAKYHDITSLVKIHQSSFYHLQESYIEIDLYFAIHPDLIVIMFTELFTLPQLSILHADIKLFGRESERQTDETLLLRMEEAITKNNNITEFLIDVFHMPQSDIINSLLTGVQRNDTIQFFTLLVSSYFDEYPRISSIQIEELFKNNQTLQAVRLNICHEGKWLLISANESLSAIDISNDIIHDSVINFLSEQDTLCTRVQNVEGNLTKLKSLSLCKPQVPLGVFFDSKPFLQHLNITLDREESIDDLFNILCSNTTIITLKIRSRRLLVSPLNSLQLMLSSNRTIQCLEISERE